MNGPSAAILFIVAVVAFVLGLAAHPRSARFFSFLPAVFWIYFLPMLAATFGLVRLPPAVYTFLITYILPASLFLLLLSTDIPAIAHLGKDALIMMFAGALGIVLGAPLVFMLVKPFVGAAAWSGFGALAGSWTGGSANMIAVKEALGTPDAIFLPMVVVDTVVPYCWMAFLIAAAAFQGVFDRVIRADGRLAAELADRVAAHERAPRRAPHQRFGLVILFGIIASLVAGAIGRALPTVKDIFSTYAWTIIAASTLGLIASATPLRRFGEAGATRAGYVQLYIVLAAIGCRANLTEAPTALILIAAGFLWVAIHALFLFVAARIIRAPLFLVAAASQANIGGLASAPIVASVYRPALASVGLLLAVLGNVVGTYMGIIAGTLCRLVAGGPF